MTITESNLLLTQREQQILNLLANGYTAKEIADNLYISTHTVHSHRKNLIMKYGARNTVHMVAQAIQLNEPVL